MSLDHLRFNFAYAEEMYRCEILAVSQVDKARRAEYDHLLISSNNGGLGFSFEWTEFVERHFNCRGFTVLIYYRGTVIAALNSNRFPRTIYGRNLLVSGAFLDHGDWVVDPNHTAEQEMLNYLALTRANTPLIIKPTGFAVQADSSQSIIELQQDSRDIWKSISSRARNDVRKAKSHELDVSVKSRDPSGFYALYIRSMKGFGTPPHGFAYFEDLLQRFGNDALIVEITYKTRVVAASISIRHGQEVHHMYAAIDDRYRSTHAGDFALWSEIEVWLNRGARRIWLGRSRKGSGVEEYKRKWKPLVFDAAVCKWQISEGSPKSTLVGLNPNKASELWSKIPVSLTQVLGPNVRRFIP